MAERGSFLVHRCIQAIHFGGDLVGALRPDEGLGVAVVLGEVAVDRRLAAAQEMFCPSC